MAIKERFSNGKTRVPIWTVRELITELQRLPPDTEVCQGLGVGADVVLYNASKGRAHVEIEEREGED